MFQKSQHYPVSSLKLKECTSLAERLPKASFTPKKIPTELVVECFSLYLLWNVFIQGMFKNVSYIACCEISSHKACCGRFPTCLVGLAYNSKSCVRVQGFLDTYKHF